MKHFLHYLSMVLAIIGIFGVNKIASAQTLYEETFTTPSGPNGTLAQFGWTPSGILLSGYYGTYAYALTDAKTLQPINGQSAFYAGNGTMGFAAVYTVDSSNSLSGFTDIAFTGNLLFSIYNQTQGGGNSNNETAYALVQSGANWYASVNALPGPIDTGTLMDNEAITAGPGSTNWVSVLGIGTSTITLGATASSDLGPITGAGVLFNLNNTSYQTFNYADFKITSAGPTSPPQASIPSYTPTVNPVYIGTTLTFNETVSVGNAPGSAPLHYQWQTDGGSGTLANINGATSTNLVSAPNTPGTWQYAVIVTNLYGSSTGALSVAVAPASAPILTSDIAPSTTVYAYVGSSVAYSATLNTGTLPISYQWLANTNGSFVDVGAPTNTLTLSNIQMTAAGGYELSANNSVGSSSSSVSTLNVLADPSAPDSSEPYAYMVYTNQPTAYWRLSETLDNNDFSVQAYDYSGNNYDAVYGNGAYDDQPGPASPSFSGFEGSNTGVALLNSAVGSHVIVPPLNLNTNTITITAWINPSGAVGANWGLFVWRGNNGDAAGFGFGDVVSNSVAELGYEWDTNSANTYNYNSGLFAPLNQWSFAALTITPTNSTMYLYYVASGTTNLLKSVQTITNYPESLSGGTTYVGGDPASGDGRDFNGTIDEVAVFNKALNENQLQKLFLTALGASSVAPAIATQPPANLLVFQGQPANLSVIGGGAPAPTYQWKSAPHGSPSFVNVVNGGGTSGATSPNLTVPASSTALDYQVVLANSAGSVTSSVSTVSVVPIPAGGKWTVNFAIMNGINNTATTPYSGSGILGTGTRWNALQTGATVSGRAIFMSDAPVYQDDGATITPIIVALNDYNYGYANAGPVGSIGLLGPYAEVGPGVFGGAAGEDNLVFQNVPNGTYSLALYGVDGGYGDQGCIFTVNGAVQSTVGGSISSFTPGGNTVLFTNVLVSGGTLIVNCTNNPIANPTQTDGAFNGAQLQLIQSSGNPAQITSVNTLGGSLVIKGTSLDAGSSFRILSTTNLVSQNWIPVATNSFAANGGFTNNIPVSATMPQSFYRVVEP